MGSFLYSGDATTSTSELQNVVENLYWKSKTFRKTVDFILAHSSNSNVLIDIMDFTGADATGTSYEKWSTGPHQAYTWPYSAPYGIIIDPDAFSGLYIDVPGYGEVDYSLERAIAHEMEHIKQMLLGQDETSQPSELQAAKFEDKVMHEAYPATEPVVAHAENPIETGTPGGRNIYDTDPTTSMRRFTSSKMTMPWLTPEAPQSI